MMSLYLDARYPGPAVELERSVVLRGDDARSAASGSCVGDILKIDALPASTDRDALELVGGSMRSPRFRSTTHPTCSR